MFSSMTVMQWLLGKVRESNLRGMTPEGMQFLRAAQVTTAHPHTGPLPFSVPSHPATVAAVAASS